MSLLRPRPSSVVCRRLALSAAALLAALQAASPAGVRAASSTVVISEFRVRGPVGGSDEFVELYNLSASPVNIGGWTMRGSNSAGSVSIRATVPSGTTLGPGCHYLFTNSSTSGGPYSGSVPGNQTYSTGITDDGGIALANASAVIIDQVGMSAGSAYKEGTPLASLGSSNLNRGYERKPGGALGSGTDTDNNATDFALLTPSAPQNLASPCVPIGGLTGTGTANPSSLLAGGTTLLTVAVTPGTSTGLAVSANLTAIGGSAAQAFFDDGTNGDATAGDLTFSYLATVAVVTPAGPKSLPATITDAQGRTGATSIALTVEPPLLAIHQIQGSGTSSPYTGQLVRTTGIVTGRKVNGFFIQTPDGLVDADPATSQGVFVFTSSAPPAAAAVGNDVSVTGTVVEFIPSADPYSPPLTEIGSPVVSVVSAGNPLPAPIVLTAADTPPTGTIEQLERLEGMRVQVDSLTVVSPTMGSISEANATATTNGVFFGVITGVARPFREPGIQVPDPVPAPNPPSVPRFDANPERLRVDGDGLAGVPAVEVTSGAVVTGITGPLDYAFRTYTLLPETAPAATGSVSAAPVPLPDTDQFTVAGLNVQRFFDTVNDPGISDVALTATALDNRLSKLSLAIRQVLRAPDILGVQEVENLGVLQAIAARLSADAVAAGEPDPAYQAYLVEGNDIGGIDVGFLVKTAGGRVVVLDVTQEGAATTYVNPNNGLPELLNDRPPLVLRAVVNHPSGPNFPITVINNHLRSLGNIDDPADGNRVRTKRRAQAEFLASLIQARQAADPSEHIVALGDFNAFGFNDGYVDSMGTIQGSPTPADQVVLPSGDLVDPNLVDLVTLAPAAQQYSFLFDGNAQELDHVLVTANLVPRAEALAYGRSGSDYPETYRNDPSRPERVSDHDALVAYLGFPRADLSIAKAAASGSVTTGSTISYTLTVSNGMGDPAVDVALADTLPPGTTFSSLAAPAGWTCSTPAAGGTGTLSCTAASLAAGASETFTLELGLDCNVANGTPVANTATVASATLDPFPANNSATTTVTSVNPAPAIGPVTASPNELWPPNHWMRDVTVGYEVTDNCGVTACSLAVASDEPIEGTGDGDTSPDWIVLDAHNVKLRAERAGMLDGRVYTIAVTCTDSAGGSSTRSTTVTVPHSQGR